jgi:hypothetical protein
MNCSQLYVGASRALSEVKSEFISAERLVHTDEDFSAVSAALEVPHLYYLASHAGCGCGWEYLGVDTEWDLKNLKSREALHAYLSQELKSGSLLLMSVNVDGLGLKPNTMERKTLAELMEEFDGWRVPYGMKAVRVASVVHEA